MLNRLPAALPLLLLPLLFSCGGGGSDAAERHGEESGAPEAPDARDIERDIRDLISAASPMRPDATAIQERDWHTRRKETLKRLRDGSPALGEAALEAYLERPDALRDVRSALLDVAAHCAPEKTQPILVELVSKYGDDLGLRKNATHYLAQTSPAVACELLEPIVISTERSATYPPNDELLEAWVTAMDLEERDPVSVLVSIATDIRQDQGTRHYAIRQLGLRPSEAGRQGLEALLVESLGNNFMRRLAAQSLRDTIDQESLCEVLRRVFDNESDVNMQKFLASMLEDRCL